MPFQSTVTLNVATQYTGSKALEALQANIAQNLAVAFSSGTGQGQAAIQWADTRTLTSAASDSIDLSGTTFFDAFGNALALTKIKGLIIQADPSNTVNLTIGNFANGLATIFGAATQSFTLQPGELFAKITPDATAYGVTAATADLLRVVNGAAASTYRIIIFGV